MRPALLAAALVLGATPAAAQTMPLPAQVSAPSGRYALDPNHASVTWRVRHMGLARYTARFAKLASTVDYDAADPTKSKLDVTIDTASVRTDFPMPEKEDFDAKIANGFLGAKANPQIRFVSTAITRTGPTSGIITGDLTLNGVTKPATLNARWYGAILHPMTKAPAFGITASGTIKRSDYGVTGGIPLVADAVDLEIEAEYQKR